MATMKRENNLVDGAWTPSVENKWFPVLDPSDGSEIAQVAEMRIADLGKVLCSAQNGFQKWRDIPGPDRAGVLLRAATHLRNPIDDISGDLVAEMGKANSEARAEVERSADSSDYFSAFGRLASGEVLPDRRADLTLTLREPVGVVLAITPWNDPLLTPARKLAPALVVGNAVILKTAIDTPLVGIHLARALHDAGLPAGALSTVSGRGSVVGPALLADGRIDAVTFTGSTETGMAVRRALAGRNLRVQNEMGGKNAAVILLDADIDVPVKTIVGAAFGQAGQRCTATSRLLIATAIYSDFVERLINVCKSLALGPGRDPATKVGPLVSPQQQSSVLAAIALARSDGATIAFGGAAPDVRLSG
jgi:acyl-CoA reductase-like NAD-dependent aldehyde dehydrogenase